MTDNSNNDGCLVLVFIILKIALPIAAGVGCWNWLEPKNFAGVLGFLLIWAAVAWLINVLISVVMTVIIDQ